VVAWSPCGGHSLVVASGHFLDRPGAALASRPKRNESIGEKALVCAHYEHFLVISRPGMPGREWRGLTVRSGVRDEESNAGILLSWLQEVQQLAYECQPCRQEISPHSQLCMHCDFRLATHCLGCGTPLPPAGASACPHCGLPLPRVTM
jgi:hypothetical protein